MECYNSIQIIITIVTSIIQAIGTIITVAIACSTVSHLYKYFSRKKIESMYGFYTRLEWNLKYLDRYLGNNAVFQNNVLYAFSADENLRDYILDVQKDTFEKGRTGFLKILCESDNQLIIFPGVKEKERYNILINSLFDYFTKFNLSQEGAEYYTVGVPQEDIDEDAAKIRGCIKELLNMIETIKSKTNT